MNGKQLFQSITKKEWLVVLLFSCLMVILTGTPYLYACLNAPANYFYNGLHSLTPRDFLVYFSYINQIKSGNWLLHDYFTGEMQTAGILNIFWLGVGLAARFFNLAALARHPSLS